MKEKSISFIFIFFTICLISFSCKKNPRSPSIIEIFWSPSANIDSLMGFGAKQTINAQNDINIQTYEFQKGDTFLQLEYANGKISFENIEFKTSADSKLVMDSIVLVHNLKINDKSVSTSNSSEIQFYADDKSFYHIIVRKKELRVKRYFSDIK